VLTFIDGARTVETPQRRPMVFVSVRKHKLCCLKASSKSFQS